MGAQQGAGARTDAVDAGSAQPAQGEHRFDLLHHPWRVRILDVLVERSMSVAQFVDEGVIPELVSMERHLAISKLAYHFRVLRQAGALDVVEQHSRRGSTERVCRANVRALLTDDQWMTLPRSERGSVSQAVLHALMARSESAVHHGTFDSRPDRHLSWLAMEVDDQGWSEMVALLNGVLDTVTAIQSESSERLRTSGEKPIRATWGQLHFESPPLVAPPTSD